MSKGTILRIEQSSIHDGEGIQTVVFLKGCPLRCLWCSTPESQNPKVESAGDKTYGQEMTIDELMSEIEKDSIFFFHSGGGVTISGGEPFCQPAFVKEILTRCHYLGISTTMESSLYVDYDQIEPLLADLDLLYADIKYMDPQKHEELAGTDNNLILSNIKAISDHDKAPAMIIRIPIVPTVNDDEDNLKEVAEFCKGLKALKRIELLPYHRLGTGTYDLLGMEYKIKEIKPPSSEYMDEKIKIMQEAAPELTVALSH